MGTIVGTNSSKLFDRGSRVSLRIICAACELVHTVLSGFMSRERPLHKKPTKELPATTIRNTALINARLTSRPFHIAHCGELCWLARPHKYKTRIDFFPSGQEYLGSIFYMSCRFYQTIYRGYLGLRFKIFVWITTFPLIVYRAQIADGPRKRRKQIMKEMEKMEKMEEAKVRSRVTFEEQPPQRPQRRVQFRRSDGDSDEHMLPQFQTYNRSHRRGTVM